jgi:hypothetical protein
MLLHYNTVIDMKMMFQRTKPALTTETRMAPELLIVTFMLYVPEKAVPIFCEPRAFPFLARMLKEFTPDMFEKYATVEEALVLSESRKMNPR